MYEKRLAWSVLFRLFHWAFALSIMVLVATGLYIHYPWSNSVIEGSRSFVVAQVRYVHFVAGFVFISALLVRLYLWFFGNRQEKLWDSAPVTPANIKNLFSTICYYLYLTDRHEQRRGHNVLAGTVYILTIFVSFFQAVSGLWMLYPESPFWGSWGVSLFGSQAQARFVHYLIMWYFSIFFFIHLYIVIWNDVKDPEGLISSIFTGRKFFHKDTIS